MNKSKKNKTNKNYFNGKSKKEHQSEVRKKLMNKDYYMDIPYMNMITRLEF